MLITTKGKLGWIWNQAKKLFRIGRKTLKPSSTIRDSLIEEGGRAAATDLAEAIGTGQIGTGRWVMDMRREVRRNYVSQYLIAKGGRENMTQADWGRLGGLLNRQYRYLDTMAGEINAGKLTKGQIRARSHLFINSARQAFERGHVAAFGMPDLPAYPGDGKTRCKTNCRCSWEIVETPSAWESTWTLHPAEHCVDCEANSRKWNPYVLPKGF